MPYLELEDIEAKALELRRVLGFGDISRLDMMTLIVKAKHFGLIKDYRRVPDDEMPDDEAAFDPYEKILSVRESAFCAMNRDETRARFTVAHEFGHVWLGHKKTRHRNVSGRAIEKITPAIKRDEAQADSFAGALLVPAHLVEKPLETSASELSERFGIGRSAAEIRKAELEKMYRRKHGMEKPIPQSIKNLLVDFKQKYR